MTNVLFAATSYPRSETDWQGIFIRRIVDALADSTDLNIRLWAPEGPRHERVESALSSSDAQFLTRLTAAGGIAHLLRNNPARAALRGAALTARLHAAYRRNQEWADVFHLNWLQCALGHTGLKGALLVTVLGSDLALLKRPGMVAALKLAFRRKRVVLCPNAEWMVPELSSKLGDACTDVTCVPFGVGDSWFQIERQPSHAPRIWVTVLRATRQKIGPLFEWTRNIDPQTDEFHLFGPLQEPIDVPAWIRHHGPATPESLATEWFPRASGLITLSQHDEGRPQVVLEAMAAGLPVIASPIPGHQSLIDHGRTGLLCATRENFLHALKAAGDPRLGSGIGQQARQRILSVIGTWADCFARYRAVYDQLETAR